MNWTGGLTFYSLGIVVYEMLVGRVPFHSDTPQGYLRKHLMDDPPSFRAAAPALNVPPAAESVVMKALAKDRNQRYASALDFASAFWAAAHPAPPPEPAVNPEHTEVVSPLTPEVSPLPEKTIDLSPLARKKFPASPAPSPSAPAPAKSDVAVQTPPPALLDRMFETPSEQPQASTPAPAPTRPPAVSQPPQLRPAPGPFGRMKIIAIAAVALIFIAAGIWYFHPPNPSPPSPAVKPVEGPGASARAAGNRAKPPDLLQQVEATKMIGDNYYQKGEYDKAISAYQSGLNLDPSNPQLLQALKQAQSAKAAEEKFSH